MYIYDIYLHTVLPGCFKYWSFSILPGRIATPFCWAEESCQTAAEPTEKMPKKMVTPGPLMTWGYYGRWDEATYPLVN